MSTCLFTGEMMWWRIWSLSSILQYMLCRTWLPSYVQLPNFISQCWSSNGNHVMSILHVLLKIPGGTYRQLPLCLTTTFVWNVPSNPSSALWVRENYYWMRTVGGRRVGGWFVDLGVLFVLGYWVVDISHESNI